MAGSKEREIARVSNREQWGLWQNEENLPLKALTAEHTTFYISWRARTLSH
jgi:hypothetical protein